MEKNCGAGQPAPTPPGSPAAHVRIRQWACPNRPLTGKDIKREDRTIQ